MHIVTVASAIIPTSVMVMPLKKPPDPPGIPPSAKAGAAGKGATTGGGVGAAGVDSTIGGAETGATIESFIFHSFELQVSKVGTHKKC